MRVAVIGSRGFADYDRMVKTLNNIKITEIVSGGASGADSLGEKYANEKEIPITYVRKHNVHNKQHINN